MPAAFFFGCVLPCWLGYSLSVRPGRRRVLCHSPIWKLCRVTPEHAAMWRWN